MTISAHVIMARLIGAHPASVQRHGPGAIPIFLPGVKIALDGAPRKGIGTDGIPANLAKPMAERRRKNGMNGQPGTMFRAAGTAAAGKRRQTAPTLGHPARARGPVPGGSPRWPAPGLRTVRINGAR